MNVSTEIQAYSHGYAGCYIIYPGVRTEPEFEKEKKIDSFIDVNMVAKHFVVASGWNGGVYKPGRFKRVPISNYYERFTEYFAARRLKIRRNTDNTKNGERSNGDCWSSGVQFDLTRNVGKLIASLYTVLLTLRSSNENFRTNKCRK